ncbi:hypothetical protein R6Q57_020646 [Mikania cordata]
MEGGDGDWRRWATAVAGGGGRRGGRDGGDQRWWPEGVADGVGATVVTDDGGRWWWPAVLGGGRFGGSCISMDKLPHSVLLQILSRLDDSADVARCRVASKDFDTVFPDLRSINLLCWVRRYVDSRSTNLISSNSQSIKPFKTIFLDLLSKQRTVESVCISLELLVVRRRSEEVFFKKWLLRLSESLKSISISGHPVYHSHRRSDAFLLITTYCNNLVNLKLEFLCLNVDNLNPMPTLTSLTLEFVHLQKEHVHDFHKCFPNLQVFNLIYVTGLIIPKIHLLNLKTFNWVAYIGIPSLTLITPNLTTLRVEGPVPGSLRVEAPMLSHFHLLLGAVSNPGPFFINKFDNLKTLWLESSNIGSLLSESPMTKSVEKLTVDSSSEAPRDATYSRFTLSKVFTIFPNVSSLCIKSSAWLELETCMNLEDLEILDGRKGLKTIRAYLMLVEPSLTFSCVAGVLDQCVGLSDISFLINGDVVGSVSKGFMSKCIDRWPKLNWRWGIWSKDGEDSWITNGLSIEHHNSSKRRHL